MVAVIAFGICGSGVGIYVGINDLIEDIRNNPNPFAGLFEFG